MAEISENISTLPEDLVIDILVRLQDVKSVENVKSIGRCKCVSKTWRSLLSGPLFSKSSLAGPESILFFDNSDEARPPDRTPYVATFTANGWAATKVELSILETRYFDPFVPVQGSCHGLVLLFSGLCLRLLNPITQESVKISHGIGGFFYGYGLGYDTRTDDFKVVSIQKYYIDIYSVRTRTWSTLENSTPFRYHKEFFPTKVFVAGRLNFMSCPGGVEPGFVIKAFNLATEEFESVPYPKGFPGLSPYDSFTVVGGCLAMVVDSKSIFSIFPWRYSFDLWLMTEYMVQDSWTKFTIKPPKRGMKPVCFLSEDEMVLVGANEGRFVRYNWRSRVWRDMVVDGAPKSIWAGMGMSFCGIGFRESLISPDNKQQPTFVDA